MIDPDNKSSFPTQGGQLVGEAISVNELEWV
jgi:hypothetical protein